MNAIAQTQTSSSGLGDRRIDQSDLYGANTLSARKAKLPILCLVSVMLASILQQGCGTLSRLQPGQAAWKGHTIDELIESWGQPHKIEKLGIDYGAYTWRTPETNCEQTFLVSNERITGYSSNDCND